MVKDGGFYKRRWDLTVRKRKQWVGPLVSSADFFFFFFAKLVISIIEGRKGKFIAGET